MSAVTYELLDRVAVVTIDQPGEAQTRSAGKSSMNWRRSGAALP